MNSKGLLNIIVYGLCFGISLLLTNFDQENSVTELEGVANYVAKSSIERKPYKCEIVKIGKIERYGVSGYEISGWKFSCLDRKEDEEIVPYSIEQLIYIQNHPKTVKLATVRELRERYLIQESAIKR